MKKIIIAAMCENGAIGNSNNSSGFPWTESIPGDLPRFKKLTKGHPIIMGRITADILKGPLPNRHNIVLSRNGYDRDGFDISTLDDVFQQLEDPNFQRADIDYSMAFIIGGSQIYNQTILAEADSIELTVLHQHLHGDAFFPFKRMTKFNYEETNREEMGTHDFVSYRRLR